MTLPHFKRNLCVKWELPVFLYKRGIDRARIMHFSCQCSLVQKQYLLEFLYSNVSPEERY